MVAECDSNLITAIVSSGPVLSSMYLCQSYLLTSEGITHLADKHAGPSIRELYIDSCQDVSAIVDPT